MVANKYAFLQITRRRFLNEWEAFKKVISRRNIRRRHLGFLAGQIGRLITISTTPVIAGDSFEMDAVGALRLSPLRRGLAIDSTVDIFTFYVPHRHVYG